MAEDRRTEAEEKAQEALHLRQRRAINNAYAALEGRKTAGTFAAFTFEEAADAQIELVEGADTAAHPNKLNRIAKIKGDITRAVEELRVLPPEMFLDVNVEERANSPSADDDRWGDYTG